MGHRITAVAVHDFKRVRDIEIAPPAEASIILLAGKNGQGKSSILDALTATLGGAKALPAEPVRRGAKQAEITIEFDGGAIQIQRVIDKKGTHLEVRNADGVVRSPQSMLDKLVGARTLDPLSFLSLKPGEQLAQLMRLIPDADRIAELNAKRESQFSRRREIGVKQKDAAGELERLREVKLVEGTPVDVAAIAAEKDKLQRVQHEASELAGAAASAQGAADLVDSSVKRKNEQLAALRDQIGRLQKEAADLDAAIETEAADLEKKRELAEKARQKAVDAKDAWSTVQPRLADLNEQLANAGERNRAIYESQGHAKRLAESEVAAKKLDDDYETCTKTIEKIDARKKEILTASSLPVAGLEVTEDAVLFQGVPFAQASRAEQLRVSIGLALSASPQLDDVWVRDAAVIDDDGIKMIADLAAAAGKRVWLEVITAKDPGAIIIQDGQVVSEVAA